MTLLAAMRHAPTAWNAQKRLQGRADIPLAPASLEALARSCVPAEFAGWRVLSSPLARCIGRRIGHHIAIGIAIGIIQRPAA
mgnify:CR=1 FL=1